MLNATLDILTQIGDNKLQINYECKTNHTVFSVADFDGNVVTRGDCHDLEDSCLDISGLSRGHYTFCIIDGEELTKLRFRKD